MPRPLPPLAANAAFFIDFDGTLVEIAAKPHLVEVEPRVREILQALSDRYDKAVAIVTGRPLEEVEIFLAPVSLPVAAEHGSVRRDATGRLHEDESAGGVVNAIADRLGPVARSNPGLLLERKKTSVALHFRERPDLAEKCAAAAEEVASQLPHVVVLPGKMVFELRPDGIDKGTAVRAFLGEVPFRGRMPVYAGDDVTDEHAFAVVNDLGGVTIKIGEGETMARYRTDRDGLLAWLEALIEPR
jgi:trehalose 6-phosphate phosphatase